MSRVLALLIVAAALLVAGCGDSDDDASPTATTGTVAETPAPTQPTTTPGEPVDVDTLVQDTQVLLTEATAAARTLVQDPQADLQDELASVEERASTVASQVQRELDAQPALRDALMSANEQLAQTAQQLQDATDADAVRSVINDQLAPAAEDVQEAASVQADALPDEVRQGLDEARDRVQDLQRELPDLGS